MQTFPSLWWVEVTLRWGTQASYCGGFSCWRAQAVGTWVSVVQHMGSVVAAHRFTCSELLRGMWNLPRPRIEPVSPALPGVFLSTVPSGKSRKIIFKILWYFYIIQSGLFSWKHVIMEIAIQCISWCLYFYNWSDLKPIVLNFALILNIFSALKY